MAQSLLGLKVRGSGFPAVFSVIGCQVSQIGNTFATMSINQSATTIAAGSNGASLPQATINVVSASTGSFPSAGKILVTTAAGVQTVTYTGTTATTFTGCTGGTGAMTTGGAVTLLAFVVGETITSGAQSAVITQVFSGRLVLNSMNASFAIISTGATFTGGTSGATCTQVTTNGMEAFSNTGTGEFLAGKSLTTNRVIQFKNKLYCITCWTIYRYNPVTSNWEEVLRLPTSQPVNGNLSIRKIGIFNVVIAGVPNICGVYGDTNANLTRFKSVDGTTWTTASIGTTSPTIADDGSCRAFVYRNVFYMTDRTVTGHVTWDPSTDGSVYAAQGTNMTPAAYNASRFISMQNRLFMLTYHTGTNQLSLFEFSGGSWGLAVGGIGGASAPNASVSLTAWVNPADNAIRVVYFDVAAAGLKCAKITLVSGVFAVTDITNPVIPVALRSGQTPGSWRLESYTDQEANALAGGPVITFIWSAVSDTAGTARAYYEYTDDATTLLQSDTGAGIEIALPDTSWGGGDRSFFSGEMDVDITAAMAPKTGGEEITFTIYPKLVSTTIAVGSNGASLPQATINVADTTGFPTSGALYVTTGAGVQTVQYTGMTGTTFTGCTGGTGAMSTGGAVQFIVLNVKLKISFGNTGIAPIFGFATLSNPSAGSLNGSKELDGLIADGSTVYKVTWLAVLSDGQSNFANAQRAVLVYT